MGHDVFLAVGGQFDLRIGQPPPESDNLGDGDQIARFRPSQERDVEIGRDGRYGRRSQRRNQGRVDAEIRQREHCRPGDGAARTRQAIAELQPNTGLAVGDGFDVERASSGMDLRKAFIDQCGDVIN